jgi:hypothetical protein
MRLRRGGHKASHQRHVPSQGAKLIGWSRIIHVKILLLDTPAVQPGPVAHGVAARFLCHVYKRMGDPSSHSYAPMRTSRRSGIMTQQRKQSHDDEKSRPRRIDNDAGCDLRTGICARGRIEHAVLARGDRPLRPAASGTRFQCFRSADGDADGQAQCAPLSWRTKIERLTFDVLDMAFATSIKGIRT